MMVKTWRKDYGSTTGPWSNKRTMMEQRDYGSRRYGDEDLEEGLWINNRTMEQQTYHDGTTGLWIEEVWR